MKISGVILAAGLGTRMLPITKHIPKPLLPVKGRPLLEITASKLFRSGASSIHVNVHHLAEAFRQRLSLPEVSMRFYSEEELLDTGGGIGNMSEGLSGSDVILLNNGDIISNIDFGPAVEFHLERGSLFTMILAGKRDMSAVNDMPNTGEGLLPPPSVYLSDSGEILDIGRIRGLYRGAEAVYGYSGLAVISPEALRFFPKGKKIGLIKILISMLESGAGPILGYVPARGKAGLLWGEIGTPSSYLRIHRRIMLEGEDFGDELSPAPLPLYVDESAALDPETTWKGFLSVCGEAVVERGCHLENCVVLPETRVAKGTKAMYCVFFKDGVLEVRR